MKPEDEALGMLDAKLSEAALKTAAMHGGSINEIRLRSGGAMSLTIRNMNFDCNVICTKQNISETVRRLCGNSLYSHSETIRNGFITTKSGMRAGVCGRAVVDGDVISSVSDISSVCIRIPHRVPGAGDFTASMVMKKRGGILIWSPPGIGKTTVLRELLHVLHGIRISAVDTRYELASADGNGTMIDYLSGYPRGKGIEIAVRTLSPELIVCDEIGNNDDAEAIIESNGSGVPVIATIHAGSRDELMRKKFVSKLRENRCFSVYIGLVSQIMGGYEYDVFTEESV